MTICATSLSRDSQFTVKAKICDTHCVQELEPLTVVTRTVPVVKIVGPCTVCPGLEYTYTVEASPGPVTVKWSSEQVAVIEPSDTLQIKIYVPDELLLDHAELLVTVNRYGCVSKCVMLLDIVHDKAVTTTATVNKETVCPCGDTVIYSGSLTNESSCYIWSGQINLLVPNEPIMVIVPDVVLQPKESIPFVYDRRVCLQPNEQEHSSVSFFGMFNDNAGTQTSNSISFLLTAENIGFVSGSIDFAEAKETKDLEDFAETKEVKDTKTEVEAFAEAEDTKVSKDLEAFAEAETESKTEVDFAEAEDTKVLEDFAEAEDTNDFEDSLDQEAKSYRERFNKMRDELINACAKTTIFSSPDPLCVDVGSNNALQIPSFGATTYQWYKNGSLIPAATSQFYLIDNAQISDSGLYQLEISNGRCAVRSGKLGFYVVDLLIEPVNPTVNAGVNVVFTSATSNTNIVSYQWYKDQSMLTGETGTQLTLNNVQLADGGEYYVQATIVEGCQSNSNISILTVQI